MASVLVIGFGLMGGSAGLALRQAGWRVRFIDPRVTLTEAGEAADERVDAPGDEDAILLATHVDGAVEWLRNLHTDGVITSLCSVMRPLRSVAPANFVAGHPIAGSHRSGIAAADPDLYRKKIWFLDAADERVERLVRDCGAEVRYTTAEDHDAAVALTSHLPQLLSTALAAHLQDYDVLDFAGSGLRDFLRLAESSAEVWKPILAANRDHIAPHADAVAQLVREIVNDPDEAFARAQATARALAERSQR